MTEGVAPLLAEMDLQVERCHDWRGAVEMLQAVPIHLVLLDLEVLTGDVTVACDRLLYADPVRSIPLVLLAGADETDRLREALLAGAEEFIHKPVEAHEVLVRARSVLGGHAWQRHAQKSRERTAIVTHIVFSMNAGLELRDAIPPVLPQIARLVGADLAMLDSIGERNEENERVFPTVMEADLSLESVGALIAQAIETGDVVLWADERADSSKEIRPFRTALIVPLLDRENTTGVLSVLRASPDPFTHQDVDSLSVVSDTLSISIARARWLRELAEAHEGIQDEMEILGRMQKLLLPQTIPEFPDLRVGAFYRTARESGGDYYDVIPLTETDIALVIADVSGHGASAAMNMGIARSVLHTVSFSRQTSPSQSMFLLNKLLCRLLGENAHITMFYAVLNLDRWTLTWTSAGHLPGFVYRAAEGKTETIAETSDGPPLGWWNTAQFEERTTELQPGDLVFLYTDGVTEALDEDERELTEDRILDVLDRLKNPDPNTALESVVSTLLEHVGDNPLEDDVTLLAVQRVRGAEAG